MAMVAKALGDQPPPASFARVTKIFMGSSPYGRGLKAIASGFAYLHGTDDHTKIALESPMYDALYAFCQQQAAQGSTS